MKIDVPPDLDSALCDYLPGLFASFGEHAVSVFAGASDGDLSADSVQVVTTGGQRVAPGVFQVQVSFDVRAETETRVLGLASLLVGLLDALPRVGHIGGMAVNDVSQWSLPYLNPDLRNPDLVRASLNTEFVVRGLILGD